MRLFIVRANFNSFPAYFLFIDDSNSFFLFKPQFFCWIFNLIGEAWLLLVEVIRNLLDVPACFVKKVLEVGEISAYGVSWLFFS